MDPALALSRFGWDLDLRTSLRRELASSSLLDPAKSSMLGPAVPGHKAAAENRSLNMSASLGTMASTTASFIGSGISDLRATVMAQQRQLDGLTDKTAGVLSAMHAELRQETQAHCHRDMNDVARRVEEEIGRVGSSLEGRFSELKDSLWEKMQTELGLVDARVASGLCEVVRGQTMGDLEAMSGKMGDLHAHLSGDMRSLQNGVMGDIQSLAQRLESLECRAILADEAAPAWELAIEHSCGALRQELFGDARDGSPPLEARLRALEEELRGSRALAQASDAEHAQLAQQRLRLDAVESSLRRQDSSLRKLAGESREVRRAVSESLDLAADAGDWRGHVESRLEASQEEASRLAGLEAWRRRVEERLEKLHDQARPLAERLGGQEIRVDAVYERLDALAAGRSVLLDQSRLPRHGDEHRLEDVSEQLEALATAVSEESRRVHQNTRDTDALGARVDSTQKALDAVQRQVADLRGEQRAIARSRPKAPQMENAMQALTEEIRTELEAQMAHAQSASRHLAAELRQELEDQITQVQSASQRLGVELRGELEGLEARSKREAALSQASHAGQAASPPPQAFAAEELRKDLEVRTAQLYGSAQKLTDEMKQLRQELEDKLAQTQRGQQQLRQDLEAGLLERPGTVEKGDARGDPQLEGRLQARARELVSDLRHDIETRISQLSTSAQRGVDECKQGLREVSSLRVGLDGVKAFSEETQRQLCDLRGKNLQQIREAIEATAREAASDAVNLFEKDLEMSLSERFARCDAAAAGCERCVRAVDERLKRVMQDMQGVVVESRAASRSTTPHRGAAGVHEGFLDSLENASFGGSLDFDVQMASPSAVLDRLAQRVEFLERHGGKAQDAGPRTAAPGGAGEGEVLLDKVSRSLAGLEQRADTLKEKL